MQKQSNKPVKEYIIERVAEDLQLSEDVVETVVSWSYKKANEAAHTKKEIELSGIGTMMLSQNKLKKRLKKLIDMSPHITNEEVLKTVTSLIEELKGKINE